MLTDTTTLSQAGRVMTDTQTVNGSTNAAWTYGYDAAGRLTSANLAAASPRPADAYSYNYAGSGGCGADTAAGKDSARSSASVTVGAGSPATTTSCTDYASRLTSATGANPLTSVTYNGHGDATALGNQSITYDSADRVTAIGSTGGGVTQSVAYILDASDRLISRVAAGTGTGSENSTTTYAYSGAGGSADLQLGASNSLAERYLSLPGGVLLTRRYTTTGGDVWSIPDLHGDIIATTGPTGTITGSGELFDPYGNPIDPTSGATNLTATPTTRTNGLTDAWEGRNQVGYEHVGGLDDTLMGARLYLPTWGQFTAPDPITSGNANAYVYPTDPINGSDLTGLSSGVIGQTGSSRCGSHCPKGTHGGIYFPKFSNPVKKVAVQVLKFAVGKAIQGACMAALGAEAYMICGGLSGGIIAGVSGYLKGDRGWQLLQDAADGAGEGALLNYLHMKTKLPGSPNAGRVGNHRTL